MKAALGDIVLNYEIIVPENVNSETTVILFLHEALGSIGQWKSFPHELCNQLGLKGIVYERQGHGKSTPLSEERDENYLHKYAFKELPSFIKSVISNDEMILLVGHSDGGTIALLYASAFPENIRGIVTMAAHVINEKETIAGIQPAIEAYLAGKLSGLTKYHGDKTHDLFYAWANIWRDDRFKQWNIVDEIGAELPGLFIQGNDDQYGTPKQLELIQSKFNNGTSLLLDDCGHHPHLEKEQNVINSINTFYQHRGT